ncbi:unnamed protein product [Caenorhabditis auriculariae]|uniref:Uncharacterized protein n=1 Tax=Caenorhabditis auriculariae TaxID=2777116 RepID=A0A8S1HSB8_9PELO|nr:unnamed protein product [Caenorhabditis auriculariae]
MWLEIRRFYDSIHQFSNLDDPKSCEAIYKLLDYNKSRLQSLLVNSKKSAAAKAKVIPNTQITIDGVELTLDSDICAESLIVSEIFQLNELESLDLVLAGESQKVHFDGLNRGLIAVVCYYDAHRLLASALRDVLQWDREYLPENLVQLIESNFIQDSVLTHLLGLHSSFSVQSEFNRLMQPNVNGLGGSKHQKLLRNVIEEIRQAISDCTVLLCHNPGSHALSFSNTLFQIVKSVPVSEKLNSVNMTAWIALVKLTSSEVLTQASDTCSILNNMVTQIRDETSWSDQPMCGSVQLACAVSLRALAASPADHLGIDVIKVDVDRVIDRAVRNMAFQYIRFAVIGSEQFKFVNQFCVVDELLKQLVCFFPAKLMEAERNSADELVWLDEGVQKAEESTTAPPSHTGQPQTLPQPLHQQMPDLSSATLHYENFLRCFVDLYKLFENDTSSAKKRLREQITKSSVDFCTEHSIELCRLLERARLHHHVVHAVAYLDLAAAVCLNPLTASFLYDTFSREFPGSEFFGWDSLMAALRSYERLFRDQNQSHQIYRVQGEKVTIPGDELSGLLAWLRLATKVASLDEAAALRMAEERSWCVIDTACRVASAPVPLPLKAQLLNLLGSLASIRSVAQRVWNSLYAHQLCYFSESGALLGVQQELEERECIAKHYEVSLAFVRLVSSLLKHKYLPDFATAFVQFVTKSILSQLSSRSYNDVKQMWSLAEASATAIKRLLEHGIVERRSVLANELHVVVLAHILNDTPLFRALCRIVVEDCDVYSDPYSDGRRYSADAALLSLQIISKAVTLHGSMRTCCRGGETDLIVSSIQSLTFTTLHSNKPITLIDVIFHYLQQADELPLHSLCCAQILREATLAPGSQRSLLDLLRARNSPGVHVRALRAALCAASIQYTLEDSLVKDLNGENILNARGETARILLETLSDAVDAEPKTQNLCYYLLALRVSKAKEKQLYSNDETVTGLHHVLYIIEQFVAAKDPLSLPFSALLEPCFRLMQRLVSVSCPYAMPALCLMRSSDLVERLITSPFMRNFFSADSIFDNAYSDSAFAVRRMIIGYILHFTALESSSLSSQGHYSKPEVFFRCLLEPQSSGALEGEGDSNILFSLLRHGCVSGEAEILYPPLMHFDVQKLQALFEACLTVTVYGVSQYDIHFLHRLLRREIEAVHSDCEDARHLQQEMESILEYCAKLNANLLTSGATERIISGCTALLNVFSVFAPFPFFTADTQLQILRDSCYVFIEVADGLGGVSL